MPCGQGYADRQYNADRARDGEEQNVGKRGLAQGVHSSARVMGAMQTHARVEGIGRSRTPIAAFPKGVGREKASAPSELPCRSGVGASAPVAILP